MRNFMIVSVLVIFSMLLGWASEGFATGSPPPKSSVQEPTDWTDLNSPFDGRLKARELVIDGHHCIVVVGDGWVIESSHNTPAISCDWNPR